MVRILSHFRDSPLNGPQSVSQESLSQPRSSYDFIIYPKSQKGRSESEMALFPSLCTSPLRRMDQVVCRPYSFSVPHPPETS